MKTITFKELIELIDNGTPPKNIYSGISNFKWDDFNETYYCEGGGENFFKIYRITDLIRMEIKIDEKPLLTEKEKAYLKAVIEPFKNEVEYITKNHAFSTSRQRTVVILKGGEYIELYLSDKFEKLETNKEYTLEELDLE